MDNALPGITEATMSGLYRYDAFASNGSRIRLLGGSSSHGTVEFDDLLTYRYSLTRRLGGDGGHVTFVMLNPSTADHNTDDPTLRRCMAFTKAWGYSHLTVVNLYALIATDPSELRDWSDPIGGPWNDFCLDVALLTGDLVIAAWGTHAEPSRATEVLRKRPLNGWKCLGQNKDGSPKHPLYLPGDTLPVSYDEELRKAT